MYNYKKPDIIIELKNIKPESIIHELDKLDPKGLTILVKTFTDTTTVYINMHKYFILNNDIEKFYYINNFILNNKNYKVPDFLGVSIHHSLK